VKFGANCGTSCLTLRLERMARLLVVPSAREPCLPLGLALAGRFFRALEFFAPARALVFLDKFETYLAVMRGAQHCASAARISEKTWIGRVDLVEPGHDDPC
jgi:hypothetical protein